MKQYILSLWQAICHPIRTFDRTFSEKSGKQLLWLIAIFLIVFGALCRVADTSFFGCSSFGTEVESEKMKIDKDGINQLFYFLMLSYFLKIF